MFNAAAIKSQTSLNPPLTGRPGTNPAEGQDFIAALSRLASYSLSAAAIVPNTPIFEGTRAGIAEDRAPAPRDYTDRPIDRFEERDISGAPLATLDEKENRGGAPDDPTATTSDAGNDLADAPATSEQPTRQAGYETENQSAETARPDGYSNAAPPTSSLRGTPASHVLPGSERLAAQVAQSTALQPSDAETPQPALQQQGQASHRAPNNSQASLTAQITNGGDSDSLPQISHTLSSRAALVAQSDGTKSAAPLENGQKVPVGDPGPASPFTTAIQSAAKASKAKGQGKSGNGPSGNTTVNGTGQNTTAAQGVSASAAQPQPGATLPAQQQTFANMQLGAGNGGSLSAQQTSAPRGELFPMAGNGTMASQFGPQGSAPTQSAKSPPPLPARFVANHVAVQIQKGFALGGDRISIQLKPAELGRVDVRLDVGHDGRVVAVITADRADTLDLLQRDARILQNSLQHAGLQADSNSLSFELKGQSQGFNQAPDGSPNTHRGGDLDGADADTTETNAAHARAGVATDDRVDIHV